MPDAAKLQFKRGLLANMPASIIDGTVYVTTDEHAMYVDNGQQRIRIGDFIPVNTVQDLPATGHAYETAVYYVKQGNILARWDATNSRWIQINKAGVVGINDAGQTGNVITGIAIETGLDGTLQLKISKATVATNSDFADLMTRVQNAESDIDNLETAVTRINGDVNTSGSILNAVNVAKLALLDGATTYTTFKDVEDAILALDGRISSAMTAISEAEEAIEGLEEDIADVADDLTAEATARSQADSAETAAREAADQALATRVTANEGAISNINTSIVDINEALDDLEPRVAANESAIAVLNGSETQTGSVRKQVADAIARIINNAPEAFDTLKEISDWISSHASDASAMNTAIIDVTNDLDALKTRVTTAEGNITTLTSGLSAANTDIDNLESAVNTLNAADTVVGSVAEKIKSALSPVKTDLNDLTERVEDLEDAVTIINGDSSTAGSIAYAVAQEATARSTADTALGTRIDTLASRVTTNEGAISSMRTTLTDVESMATEAIERLSWVEF